MTFNLNNYLIRREEKQQNITTKRKNKIIL